MPPTSAEHLVVVRKGLPGGEEMGDRMGWEEAAPACPPQRGERKITDG